MTILLYFGELRGSWLDLTIHRKEITMTQNTQNQSVGSAIARVAVDMLKITVAVAGGIAVYKLAENYLSGSDSTCLGCGGGAVPELGTTGGTYVTTSADADYQISGRTDHVANHKPLI